MSFVINHIFETGDRFRELFFFVLAVSYANILLIASELQFSLQIICFLILVIVRQ